MYASYEVIRFGPQIMCIYPLLKSGAVAVVPLKRALGCTLFGGSRLLHVYTTGRGRPGAMRYFTWPQEMFQKTRLSTACDGSLAACPSAISLCILNWDCTLGCVLHCTVLGLQLQEVPRKQKYSASKKDAAVICVGLHFYLLKSAAERRRRSTRGERSRTLFVLRGGKRGVGR